MHVVLDIIDYARLVANEQDEIQKLILASSTQGAFFLNLQGSAANEALLNKARVIRAQRNFFARGMQHKQPYSTGVDHDGYASQDDVHVQTLKISRMQQIQGQLALPLDLRPIQANLSDLAGFIDLVLRRLSFILCTSLDPSIPVEVASDDGSPGISNLCLGLAAAPIGTSLMEPHTDSDLLTMTFYDSAFLELHSPETGEWCVVDVNANMPLVNIGRSFQSVSGNKLKAPSHGVRQSDGDIDLVMYDLHRCSP
ncbi:hypothetical protein CC79DRAFT_1355706 [Sarocladium strictum]